MAQAILTKEGVPVNEYGMAQVTFRITSITAMLMHNPEFLLTEPEEEGLKVKAKRRPALEQAALSRYHDTERNLLYLPANNLRASLIEGGTNRQFGPRKPATKVLGANLFVIDGQERCYLTNPITGQLITGDDYVPDVRRVRLPQGTSVLAGRAKIPNWACEVTFDYDPDLLTAALIAEVFVIAGRSVGVCDYRPRSPKGKGGPFGRYRVEMIA